jgi:hypothetical protein
MATSETLSDVASGKRPTLSKEVLRTVHTCKRCGRYLIGTPVLQCEHGHILPIRCYWYRKNGAFYAECLDFDIITRAETAEEAIGRLQEDMWWYVDTVLSGGSSEGLIPRKAPFWSWVRYYAFSFVRLLCTLFSTHDKTDHHITSVGHFRFSPCR